MASNQRDDDYRVDVARLLVGGATTRHIFGRNPVVGNTMEDVWGRGGEYVWAQAASTLSVVSDSANDTILGTGVRTVHIFGLGSSMEEIDEAVEMNGLTPVVTTQEFLRVNDACSETQGTYQASTTSGGPGGDILIDRTSDGSPECALFAALLGKPWDYNQSMNGRFTVPAGKNAYMTRMYINAQSNRVVDFVLWKRERADVVVAPFGIKRSVAEFDGISTPFGQEHNPPIIIPPKTDLWWSAIQDGGGGDARVTVSFEIILDEIING